MTPKEYEYLADIAKAYPHGDILVAGTEYGEDVRTFMKVNPNRNIIVIDSFQGLAPPVKEDMAANTDFMKQGECDIGGLEVYLKTFKKAGLVPPREIYQMWIDDKELQKIPIRPISIMFLDLDHYAPTKACLKRFGKQVSDGGGTIIVHDYDFERCPGIKKCCDEWGGRWKKVKGTGFARYYPENFRLEIGSGVNPTNGFVHLDIDPKSPHLEILTDAMKIPIHDEVVTELLSVNTLEHIEWPFVRPTLKEWGRLVIKGGTIRIHVPDMLWLVTFFQDQRDDWKKDVGVQPFNAANDKWEYLNHYVMSTNAPYNMHRSVYTEQFLRTLLSEVGFGHFQRLQTDPRWLYLQGIKE